MAIPFVIIELDRPRKLRFGMAATLEFQDVAGCTLQDIGESMGLELAAKALWVMLKQDDPELTLKDTYRLVDEYAPNLVYVTDKIGEAITAAYTLDAPGNPPKPAGK